MRQLFEAGTRLGLEVEVKINDWEKGSSPELGQFDGVLVDAPCTGLGTIRRHPEIRWKRLPSDPAAMAIRQLRILRNASERVVEGGVLVYSVCTPTPEEGRGVVEGLSGWEIGSSWKNLPPENGEDIFQCFVLRRLPGS